MSGNLTITTFTDPMMGLSWECEPIFRKLETHFTGQIEFRTVMALLVRNVRNFMTQDELALPPAEGIRRYNARLAKIYESEEPISGMPINMTRFRLFSVEQPPSLPLNLAYHAARQTDASKADLFLYNLRYATIVDCRPTTETDELVNVAKTTGIDTDTFLRHFRDGSAKAALNEDLRLTQSMGIHSLPAYLLQYGGKAMLLRSFDYQDFASVISQLTNGTRKPQSAAPTGETLREFLREHPLISFIELREAFDFADTETVRELVQPLIERGEAKIEDAYHGWFVRVKSFYAGVF